MSELPLLYLDDHVVAVDKPNGMLVHRSNVDRSETRIALQRVRDQIGRYVYPVHRLDKSTSGVLLFALSRDDARVLAAAFAERQVEKRYLAVVRGYADPSGTIDHPLRERLDRKTDARARSDKPAQDATTAYRLLARAELPIHVDRYPTSRYSLVEACPRTGRKHQLRRHFKHIAHPIIGDRKYGKNTHNDFFIRHFGCRRLLLHAASLCFPHPATGQVTVVSAPPDAAYERVLEAMGWQTDWNTEGDRDASRR